MGRQRRRGTPLRLPSGSLRPKEATTRRGVVGGGGGVGTDRRRSRVHALGLGGPDLYVPIRTGTDIAFSAAVSQIPDARGQDPSTSTSELHRPELIVREEESLADAGLYSATTRENADTTNRPGTTRSGRTGYVKATPRSRHPRCVYQLMKTHSAPNPEMVEARRRHADEGKIPAGFVRDDRLDLHADRAIDHHVRPGGLNTPSARSDSLRSDDAGC